MSVLPLVTVPHPILSKKCEEINLVDDSIRKLMDDMVDTIRNPENLGVGLAANQAGFDKRIIVVELDSQHDDMERPANFYPLRIANPVITQFSDNYTEAEEGCLSVPLYKVKVSRPDSITLEYIDYDNNKQNLNATNWLARVILHELDHINGKTLLDHMSPLKRNVALRKIKKFHKTSQE